MRVGVKVDVDGDWATTCPSSVGADTLLNTRHPRLVMLTRLERVADWSIASSL